jgi:porphobilinogen deaminase
MSSSHAAAAVVLAAAADVAAMRHELTTLKAIYTSAALNTAWQQLLVVPESQDADTLFKVLQQLTSQHTVSKVAADQVAAHTLLQRCARS